MNTLFTGKVIIHLPETGSTNLHAAGLLKKGAKEGTVVLADWQSAGRGQVGNTWVSAPGMNLTFSLIYRPIFIRSDALFVLNKMTSLAIRNVISRLLPAAEVLIKWPNDILLNRRKLAGILIENQLEGYYLKSSIIGIGLNVNQLDFPEMEGMQPVSLRSVSGFRIEPQRILEKILQEMEGIYMRLRSVFSNPVDPLDEAYCRYLYGYLQSVPLLISGEQTHGMVLGVERSGRLKVDIQGRHRSFDLKEVVFQIDPL